MRPVGIASYAIIEKSSARIAWLFVTVGAETFLTAFGIAMGIVGKLRSRAFMSIVSRSPSLIGPAAVATSLVATNVGAALAKGLFPAVGAPGVVALRVGLAAALLMLLVRPWRQSVPRSLWYPLLGYGVSLGLMNASIYQAFSRIPLGIAVGIEVTGPLLVVVAGSRRAWDFLWLGLAVVGLWILLPLRAEGRLDPTGVAFALAAALCWAAYILLGSRVSKALGGRAVAWGMLLAAGLTLPLGVATAGVRLLEPSTLVVGLGVALASSVLPYTLEMQALRHTPPHVFGLLVSSAPAVAAIAGGLVLGERLSASQWMAITCIMIASAGAAVTMQARVASVEGSASS